MDRFKENQRVVCIGEKEGWYMDGIFTGYLFWKKKKKTFGPAKGEIVTVHRVFPGHICIKEYLPNRYVDLWFEPLQENVSAIELKNQELCKN